ncbi:MAG: hypothetical protein ACLU4J_22345 [Butyricimonas paravirosa]
MKESVTCNQSTCNSPEANSYNPEFMKEAIRIAVENVEKGREDRSGRSCAGW